MKGASPALIFLLGMAAIVAIGIGLSVSFLKGQNIEVLMNKGKYDDVIQTAGRLLEAEPKNLRYQELFIEALIREQKFPEAEHQFRYVLQEYPDGKQLCPAIAQFLGEAGHYQLASQWLRDHCSQPDTSPAKAITRANPVKKPAEPIFFAE